MTEHLTKIIHRLTNLGIPVSLLTNYSEPHRFYHNLDHISSMCEEANRRGVLTDELLLSIFFHDIIYDPKATDNEEKSAELYRDTSGHSFNSAIFQAILDTKTHKATSELSANLCDLDLQVLYGGEIMFQTDEDKDAFAIKYHGRYNYVININRDFEKKHHGFKTIVNEFADPQYYIDISVTPMISESF